MLTIELVPESLLSIVLFAQAQAPAPVNSNAGYSPYVILAAVVGWGALWGQMVIIPFYQKGESLSKDYKASGRINTAIAAIESNRLITAIAGMFRKAMDSNPDKRTRPNIEELLDSTMMLPYLEVIQKAMKEIEDLKRGYERLGVIASRLWKWALVHVLSAPVLFGVYVGIVPEVPAAVWGIYVGAVIWLITLLIVIFGLFKFHGLMGQFNKCLESHGGD